MKNKERKSATANSNDRSSPDGDFAAPSLKFFTVPQVAELLVLSDRHVWREIESEELIAHGFGSATRIAESDLKDYISRRRRKPKIPKKKQRK